MEANFLVESTAWELMWAVLKYVLLLSLSMLFPFILFLF